MQHIFAILPNQASSRSFERYFKFAYQARLHTYQIPAEPSGEIADDVYSWVTTTFADISGWLNSAIQENELNSGIGIIELYDERLLDLSYLNPVFIRHTWAAAAAMLVLAFPEIYWIFITSHPLEKAAADAPENQRFDRFHRIRFAPGKMRLNLDSTLKIGAGNFPPLFDPFGFRNSIRESICRTDSPDNAVNYIPRRKQIVVSIDEEEDYACFIGYIAYRFGYRALQVNSFLALTKLKEIALEKFHIVFEDMFLNFPDRPPSVDKLSNLKKRHASYLPKDKINHLAIVTSGHDKSLDEVMIRMNKAFTNAFEPGRFSRINKPFSGIFRFWLEANQVSENGQPFFADEYKKTLEKMRTVESRVKSPKPDAAAAEQETPADRELREGSIVEKSFSRAGHSADGRLLMIANCLIKRATRLSENATTAKDAALGATLALEAIEYLGYRTPTVSLQALSLKNKLEAMAEAMFYGVGYSISQAERFDEIEKEIQALGKWYKEDGSAVLNAEIKIINDIALVFQQKGLFDEERECMDKSRYLYQQLLRKRQTSRSEWYLMKRLAAMLSYLENRIVQYAHFLLRSVWNFILCVLGWVTGFALVFAIVLGFSGNGKLFLECLGHGLYDTCVAFFSMQPAHDLSTNDEKIILVLSVLCIIISYFHLGIFISYIYSLITRKL